MKIEVLEKLQQQLRPEGWLALMATVLVLTVLAAYLYLLKPSLARYRELAQIWSPVALEDAFGRAEEAGGEIVALEQEVRELQDELYGGAAGLPLEQMESFVIDRLDRISVQRGVQLVSVKPGELSRVLMFDEMPYDVDVAGEYFALYDWLQAVEEELRPMVVKRFAMQPGVQQDGVSMRLRLVSYRPLGEQR